MVYYDSLCSKTWCKNYLIFPTPSNATPVIKQNNEWLGYTRTKRLTQRSDRTKWTNLQSRNLDIPVAEGHWSKVPVCISFFVEHKSLDMQISLKRRSNVDQNTREITYSTCTPNNLRLELRSWASNGENKCSWKPRKSLNEVSLQLNLNLPHMMKIQ